MLLLRRSVCTHFTGLRGASLAIYLLKPVRISRSSAEKLARLAAGSALTTMSVPGGIVGISCAIIARSLRFTRFRVTADPTALDTTKPARGARLGSSRRRWSTRCFLPNRAPCRTTRSKSAEQRIRCAAGSTTRIRQKVGDVPYDGAQIKSHVRRGYACVAGSHEPWHDGAYSAEKSAYSRQISKLLRGSHSKLDHFELKNKVQFLITSGC